jgi:hypothetical protein
MGPRQPTTVAGRSVRHVLAGGEVFGGEEPAARSLAGRNKPYTTYRTY